MEKELDEAADAGSGRARVELFDPAGTRAERRRARIVRVGAT